MHEEVRGNDVIKRRYLYCEIYLYKASSMLNERDGARTKKTGLSTNFSLAIVSRKQVYTSIITWPNDEHGMQM